MTLSYDTECEHCGDTTDNDSGICDWCDKWGAEDEDEDEVWADASELAIDIRDAVDIAFDDLNKNGILAKADFMCCSSCAIAAFTTEVVGANFGVAWYHNQDAEMLARAEKLYIGYSDPEGEEGPLTQQQVGERVRDALERQGLDVEWDGDPMRRIVVAGFR